MATIRSSDLDFDTIKANLKTYFQKKKEFNGYDFEGSGLSNILDVLAYNTHLNGLIANIGINESFLKSAQLRSSVVSHAENLGYFPRSKTASTALINVSISSTNTTTGSIDLPADTTFTGNVDDIVYTFRTLERFSAANDGSGNFIFKTSTGSDLIPITEGTLKTKTFIVGETTEDQVYVIPDINIDTSTLVIKVKDTAAADITTADTYSNINDTTRVTTDSKVYIVREAPNSFYELIFSDGTILGKAPQAGNVIVVTYISTNGSTANGVASFESSTKITVESESISLTVGVPSGTKSAGGSEKESLESIKLNAPTGFATQQRLVTAEDYKTQISERFSNVVQDVSAWGGNENVPKDFGTVYISLNFKDGITDTVKSSTKSAIKSTLTDNLSIMSIDTEFVDPAETFVEVNTTFNFDPDLSGSTATTTESTVKDTINTFFTNNLSTFNTVLRKSKLLTTIDAISPAILDSTVTFKLQQKTLLSALILNVDTNYTINFPVKIANPDDINHIVTSTSFTFLTEEAVLRNKLGTNQLEIVNSTTAKVLKDNAGTYDTNTGQINIVGVAFQGLVGPSLDITAVPQDENTIKPLRNFILKLDTNRNISSAVLDFQNTKSTI